MDSAGVSLAELAAGEAWPPPLLAEGGGVSRRYEELAARRVSFNAGPCAYARYIYGGGAEFRGVQADEARHSVAAAPYCWAVVLTLALRRCRRLMCRSRARFRRARRGSPRRRTRAGA